MIREDLVKETFGIDDVTAVDQEHNFLVLEDLVRSQGGKYTTERLIVLFCILLFDQFSQRLL